jgi:two-component system OmpR family sensor kinase
VGRLFWKFFLFVWLAQMGGIIAVGSLFWLTDPRGHTTLNDLAARPEHGPGPAVFAARPDSEPHRGPRPPPPKPRYWPRNIPPPVAVAATLAASVVTALLLAWYVAKPIRSLRGAFEAAAGGDLNRRIAAQIGARNDELADLGRDFDRMASRLQVSMEGQRRLLHDVSHELRSPLARLQAAVGILRQKPEQPTDMITRIEDEIARIDRLVGELLTLSRLEAGELVGVEEEIDMHDLVAEVVRDTNFEAQTQDRQVIWDESGSVTLQGRPELLHSAIENVLRNSLKHAPESRSIWIETTSDAVRRRYIVRVLDEGRGIPPDELPHLFTPFARGVNTVGSDGYGLGLAIARRCVEAHRGTIRAENRPAGGLCVEIVLPWPRNSATNPVERRE